MRLTTLSLAGALALATEPAAAVIIRHDVSASSYESQAAHLPGYCQLEVPDGGAVLIGPLWVLTAAHMSGDLKVGHRFHCGEEVETIDQVIVNPAFGENVGRHDLALIRLVSPSKLQPVLLSRDPLKTGELVELIGHYQGGTGLTGGVGRNPAGLRGATNRVSEADENWLRLVFDAPSSQATTPLEGVSGGGDSGAPAYRSKGGKLFVVGIGSRSLDTNHNGIEQDYGDTDLYVPIASHLAWIEQTIGALGRSADRVSAAGASEARVFDRLSSEGFSGSVSVHQGGRVLLERGAGQANVLSPFELDTKVDIASIAKPITALAIVKLSEHGKLRIDDPLGKWFPEAPADKRKITLRQMLNHSSGLVDIPPGMSDYHRTSEPEMQRRVFAEPLDFPPGSKNSYSNSGYNLLGMIVEKASGRPLFQYLEAEIFRPAQVRASYDPEAFPASKVASKLSDAAGAPSVRQVAAARNGPFWGLWGAGGVFMSAPELAKLFRAFWEGKIVSQASVMRMTKEVVPAGSYASEGLGWTIIHTHRGDDFVSYTGGSEHSNSAVRYYPRQDVLVAAVANSPSPGAVRMARELAEPLVGPDFRPNTVPPGTPPLGEAPAADVQAIRAFMSAVARTASARLEYIQSSFSPGYRETSGETALSEKLGNLASIGAPKVISIFRRDADSVLLFETQESEYPRMYELVLHRSKSDGMIEAYEIRRVSN
jgi:D-alanyl-D-alanine carboxypeptidase